MKSKILSALLFSLATISTASFAGNEDQDLATEFHGIKVPPMPPASQDVLGTDSDKNGIRDDIDRFIAKEFGDNKQYYKWAVIASRSVQNIMKTNPLDKAASTYAISRKFDVGFCMEADLNDFQQKSHINNITSIKMKNNSARTDHYEKVYKASSAVYDRSKTPNCEFN